MMPGMDGIETLQRIRDEKLCDDVPVIMLTANATVGSRERYLAEGFQDFLSKPVLPDQLDAVILQYLPEKLVHRISGNEVKQEVPKAEPNKVGEESMESKAVFEQIKAALPEFDYESAMKTCMEDEEFYLELFRDFSELPIRKELQKYLEANDVKNYCIRIHGFKNNLYSIGARKLGDFAYEMEKITKQDSFEGILQMQEKLLEAYGEICTIYEEIVRGEEQN